MMFKQLPTMISNISQLGDAANKLKAINFSVVGLNSGNIDAYRNAVSLLSKEQATLLLSSKGLNQAQIDLILSNKEVTASEIAEATATASIVKSKALLTAEQQKQLLTSGAITSEKLAEIAATLGLETAENGSLVAKKALNVETVKQQLTSMGIVGSTQAQIVSMLGLTTAETGAATAGNVLTGVMTRLSLAMSANPIGALVTVIGLAITAIWGLSKAFDALTDSAEEIDERVDSLIDKYNEAKNKADENANTVESLASEYEELSKGVNNLGENISLTSDEYDRYNQIVNQIADMFPDLISGYTEEGNAILSLKGNVESLRDAYKEAQQEAYNLLVAKGEDSDGEDIVEAYKNLSELDFWDSDNVIGAEDFTTTARRDITKQILDLMKDLETAPEEYDKLAKQIFDTYGDRGYNLLEEMGLPAIKDVFTDSTGVTEEALKSARATVQAYYQGYQSEINNKLKNIDTLANAFLLTNEDYSKLDEQSKTAASLIVNSITEDIANGFHSKEDVGAYVADIVSQLKDNPDLSEAMIGLFTTDLSDMSVDDANDIVDQYINTIAKILDEDPVELKVRLGFDDYNDNDIEPLKTKVQGFLKDEFDDKVGELSLDDLQVASKLEIPEGILLSWDELKQKIEETKNAVSNDTFSIPDAETLKQQISDLNSAIDSIQSAYDTLNSAVEEYNSNGGQLSIDTIQSLLSLSDEYLACLQVENGQLSLNADAMAQLAQAKLNEAQATAVTQAMTELQAIANGEAAQSTTTYISGNAALMSSLAQLSGSYEGVAQAAMTAAQAQELSAQISAASAKDKTATENVMKGLDTKLKLIQSTKNAISAGNFASVSKKTSSGSSSKSSSKDELKEAFQAEYDLLKHNLDMEYITEEQYYNGVQALNEKYFAGKEKYLDDYRKYEEEVYKGLKSYYKSYCDDMMDYYDKKLDASKMSYKEYCDSVSKMLADMHNSGKISDKDWYDYTKTMLEKQKDAYDRALSAITRRLQKEIDKIQDQIDTLNDQNDVLNEQKDNYDKILSAVSNVYDKEIDRLNEQKDLLQDQIDALNDKNDALDLQYRKEQALYALQKAQQQRTRKLYVEGKGYIYDTDNEAIRDAQKDLDDITNEELINSLQKEQDKIQESIDILEKYKEKWNEIPDAWDKAVSEQLAIELWGQEYEKLILLNRTSDIENFKNKYLKIQSQINDNEELIESLEEKKTLYNKLKEQWQSLTDEYSNSVDDMYAKMLLGQSWESDVLNGRLSTLNNFRNQYNDIQKSISDMAWQSANAQISALNAVKAAEATKAQTSGGSNGYSGSSGNVSSVGGNTSGGSGLTAAQKYQVRLAGTVKVIYEGSSETDLRNWITRNNYIGVSRTIQNNIIIYFAKKKEKKYIGQVYKTSGQASSQVGMLGGVGYDKVSGGYQVYKYAKGTNNAKPGIARVSEKEYGDEILIKNDNTATLVRGEQLVNFEGGEKVIPANETKEILKNQGNVEQLSDSDVITRKDGSILKPLHYEYENILTNFIKDNPDYMYSMNNISDNLCKDLFKNTENVNYDNRNVDNRVSIGEIHLHKVQDVDQFARELDRQLVGIVDQKLSRRKR